MGRDLLNSAAEIQSISSKLDAGVLRFVNPVNSVEERELFFKEIKRGKEYNPRFTYLPKNPLYNYFALNPEYEKIRKQLISIYSDNSVIGKMLKFRKRELLEQMELVKSIGSEEFTANCIFYYGKPSKSLLDQAFELVQQKPKRVRRSITAEKAKSYLSKSFAKKKIRFRIELDPQLSANAVVMPSRGLLRLRQGTVFSRAEVKRLELHEIQTHVYRYLNGSSQVFQLFAAGTSKQWHMADEGLAAVNEEFFGLLSETTLKMYAGRVLAIDYALSHSFNETYLFLRNFFSKNNAYILTQRVKRGLPDTSKPGAFTKDMIYLKGMNKVKQFLDKGNSLEDLYIGRVGFEEAKVAKNLDNIKKARYLPNYKKIEKKA